MVGSVLLAGCSSTGAGGAGGQSSAKDASASASPTPADPAPTEAAQPVPSVMSGNDPSVVLAKGGDLRRLGLKVTAGLQRLQTMHVEESFSTGLRMTYDVDFDRCSGEIEDSGVSARFVTTSDGRMLATRDPGPAPRWTEVGYVLVDSCTGGPLDVAFSTVSGAGSLWPWLGATRVGVERIGGVRTVHYRKSGDGQRADSWLAADGSTVRMLKLVRRIAGKRHTLVFSEFDQAEPVEPEQTVRS